MKVKTTATLAGEFSLEVIAENEFEFAILERAWKLNGYERANGNTIAPGGGKTGFYVPLFQMSETKKP